MVDIEDEKHVDRIVSSQLSRPVHKEEAERNLSQKTRNRSGVVLSCGSRRKAKRRKDSAKDFADGERRSRARRQTGPMHAQRFGNLEQADQIVVIALKKPDFTAPSLKPGDAVYVEPVFQPGEQDSRKPEPAAPVGQKTEPQKPKDNDRDYIVSLSGKSPKAE